MEEKVLPSFGDTQDHPGSTSETLSLAAWHRGLTGYVFGGWAEGNTYRWLSLALLAFHASACLWRMEQGACSQGTPQIWQQRRPIFSRKFTAELGK